MDNNLKKELAVKACKVRMGIIEGVYSAQAGHPGGSLSIADILTYLYSCEMNVTPETKDDCARDRFVLSKGHAAPALYAVLANSGFFPVEDLKTLRKTNSYLQGHPDMNKVPGVDMSTGSLGQGVSAACGMALAAKLQNKDYRVYTILGDGELEEGEVWEAAMFASQQKLDNLCVIVDNNGLQIDGDIATVCSPYPIDEKYKAFGFEVITIDAHDFDEIEAAFAKAKTVKGRPTVIIQKSVKGKGVSYMENDPAWHGAAPKTDKYEIAMQELRAALAELEAK